MVHRDIQRSGSSDRTEVQTLNILGTAKCSEICIHHQGVCPDVGSSGRCSDIEHTATCPEISLHLQKDVRTLDIQQYVLTLLYHQTISDEGI